jgi:AbrB family looped-hinge helix DNA binding protein
MSLFYFFSILSISPKALFSLRLGLDLYWSNGIVFMVKKVEDAIKVDKQGRLVLPSHIREAFGIKQGGQLTIRIDGSKAIIEPVKQDVKKKVQEWEKLSRNLKAEAFTEETNESWKWMSREYARRKLGLS